MNYQKAFGNSTIIRKEIRRQQIQALPQWARHLGATLAISGGLMFFLNNALLDRTAGLNNIRASLLSSGQSQLMGVGLGVGAWYGFKSIKRQGEK